jgi:hypothetical protein
MSLSSSKQIEAQVSAIRRSMKSSSRYFAIRATDVWNGPDRLMIDGAEHLVFPCVSDLQVRESFLRAEADNKPAVLLCSMAENTLGDDVLSRLAKHKVFAPQLREMVAELFSARIIDPRVLKTKPLMNGLLEKVPVQGYAPVPGGTLDLQTAWLTLLSQIIGETVEFPSLTQILEWSLSPDRLRRLMEMEPDLKAAFTEWFVRARGEPARFIMAALESGHGNDLIPLGAVMGLVFDPQHFRDTEHQAARGRLDKYLQGRMIDAEAAAGWYRAAQSLLSQWPTAYGPQIRRQTLNRLDDLIGDLGLLHQAWACEQSPQGLEQRYQQLGQALTQSLAAKSSSQLGEVRDAISRVKKHLLGMEDPERLERMEMACRMIRWLQTTAGPARQESFDEMVNFYHQDGGFIDWARYRLKESDLAADVRKAFDSILERVDQRARTFEKDFAVQLQDWTRSEHGPDRFILIEDVLEKVVTPVAKQQAVLLLVLDGMSVAVFRQLMQGILRQDWTEIVREENPLPKPVLATLPSVTAISRRSLFLGKLSPATNGTEQGEFQKNDLLFKGSGSQVRPQLFRMGDLTDDEQGGIANQVRQAISDKKCRVVSVVLNAIDDHLDSGKQIDFSWEVNRIRGLKDILRQASEAGRLVMITSDHGHILDFGTKMLASPKDERGDRFRLSTDAVVEGELEFEGSRVNQATGRNRITLAWSDKIRYGKDKRGYHGGANPQEMVVPFAIISDARAEVPDGWREVATYQPPWWSIGTFVEPEMVPAKGKAKKDAPKLELFEHAQVKIASGGADWIGALLASPLFQEQTKLALRGAPTEELLRKLLGTLDARGGSLLKPALARELGMPAFRVDGLIQNVSRILNVDGYEVIGFDRSSDTVSLNVRLLCTQFEIKTK